MDHAQLQGTDFDYAELQHASLKNIFTWRAKVSGEHNGARVIEPKTEPQYAFGDCLSTCDWSAKSFGMLSQSIKQEVPEGERRNSALQRIAILDPVKRLDGERLLAKAWVDLAGSQPLPQVYEQSLADRLRETGCDVSGAPYVIRALLPNLAGRFGPESAQPAALAAAFLDEGKCAGALRLSENDKVQLRTLRKPPAQAIEPSPK
jgi:hypothetical protein